MSLSNDYAPIKQIGNGVTVDFSGTWKVLVASYIRVYKQNIATGVKTLMAVGTDYTLVFSDAGFTVTYVVAPTAAEYALIARVTGADQTAGYKTAKGFDGSAIEVSLDKLTAIVQDHAEYLSRALLSPLGSAVLNIELPVPSAGKGLRWNDAGTALQNTVDNIDGILSGATTQAGIATAAAATAVSAASSASADATQTGLDRIAVAADRVQTGLDAVATAADRVQTGLDRTAASNSANSASNSATVAFGYYQQTGLDAIATAADRVQTGLDKTAAAASAVLSAAAAGFGYKFSTNTASSDPTAGFLKFNNATLSSATAMYISETTNDAQAIAALLATLDDSTSTIRTKVRLFKQSDPTVYAIFNITGTITDNGTWDTFTVAYVAGNGAIANNDVLTAQFLTTGDKGDTGAAGTVQIADAGGTADALTGNFTPDLTLADKTVCFLVAGAANATTTPTFAPDGLTARTMTKNGGSALAVGDIAGAGHVLILEYNLAGTRWELLNPKVQAAGATDLDGLSDVVNDTTGKNLNIGNSVAFISGQIDNIFIGERTTPATMTGAADRNTGIGRNILKGLTSGSENTALGSNAGFSISTGTNNTAIGQNSIANQNVSHNTACGYGALDDSSGTGNTALGSGAGGTCGSGGTNTLIGYLADVVSGTDQNAIAIGYQTTAGSNAIVIGNSTHTAATLGGAATTAVQLGNNSATVATVGASGAGSVKAANTAKCWLKAGVTGNILASFNITSLTDTGTGDIAITIATDFSSADWSCTAIGERASSVGTATNSRDVSIKTGTQAAGSVSLECWDKTATTNVIKDPNAWHMQGFGAQ